jgi:hypothetical protein
MKRLLKKLLYLASELPIKEASVANAALIVRLRARGVRIGELRDPHGIILN